MEDRKSWRWWVLAAAVFCVWGVCGADWSVRDRYPWQANYIQPPPVDAAWFKRSGEPFMQVFQRNYLRWGGGGVCGRPVYGTVRGVRHTTIITLPYGDKGLEPWEVGDCNYDGQVDLKDLGVYARFYSRN